MKEYDALSREEKLLYDALLRMLQAESAEPSDVRILEIGNYRNRTRYGKDEILYGPDTVLVRLRHEAHGSETLIRLCIAGAEAQNALTKEMVHYARRQGARDFLLMYEGEPGDYAVPDGGCAVSPSAEFDAERINRALRAQATE